MVPSREARQIVHFWELDSGLDIRACRASSRLKSLSGMARSNWVEVGNGRLGSGNSAATGSRVVTGSPSELGAAFDSLSDVGILVVTDTEDKVRSRIDLKAYTGYVDWNWDTSCSHMG